MSSDHRSAPKTAKKPFFFLKSHLSRWLLSFTEWQKSLRLTKVFHVTKVFPGWQPEKQQPTWYWIDTSWYELTLSWHWWALRRRPADGGATIRWKRLRFRLKWVLNRILVCQWHHSTGHYYSFKKAYIPIEMSFESHSDRNLSRRNGNRWARSRRVSSSAGSSESAQPGEPRLLVRGRRAGRCWSPGAVPAIYFAAWDGLPGVPCILYSGSQSTVLVERYLNRATDHRSPRAADIASPTPMRTHSRRLAGESAPAYAGPGDRDPAESGGPQCTFKFEILTFFHFQDR